MGLISPGGAGGADAVSIADGANVVEGALADAAITTSAAGSISGKLRGIISLLVSGITVAFTAPTNSTSAAYETNRVAKATPGTLWGLTGYNSKTSAQFIQIHDAASLPADTAVPKVTVYVAAQSSFALGYEDIGRAFAVGIVVCNSSTGPTKTIGAADCWFDVQYT